MVAGPVGTKTEGAGVGSGAVVGSGAWEESGAGVGSGSGAGVASGAGSGAVVATGVGVGDGSAVGSAGCSVAGGWLGSADGSAASTSVGPSALIRISSAWNTARTDNSVRLGRLKPRTADRPVPEAKESVLTVTTPVPFVLPLDRVCPGSLVPSDRPDARRRALLGARNLFGQFDYETYRRKDWSGLRITTQC
jgi:hypothetical protein